MEKETPRKRTPPLPKHLVGHTIQRQKTVPPIEFPKEIIFHVNPPAQAFDFLFAFGLVFVLMGGIGLGAFLAHVMK